MGPRSKTGSRGKGKVGSRVDVRRAFRGQGKESAMHGRSPGVETKEVLSSGFERGYDGGGIRGDMKEK